MPTRYDCRWLGGTGGAGQLHYFVVPEAEHRRLQRERFGRTKPRRGRARKPRRRRCHA